jgi:hypothetical protein
VAALLSRRIGCRVYDYEKLHAKAYITHAKLEVVGAQLPARALDAPLPSLHPLFLHPPPFGEHYIAELFK